MGSNISQLALSASIGVPRALDLYYSYSDNNIFKTVIKTGCYLLTSVTPLIVPIHPKFISVINLLCIYNVITPLILCTTTYNLNKSNKETYSINMIALMFNCMCLISEKRLMSDTV